MKIRAYVFAGGQSRRFGTNKALARLPSGQTLLDHNVSVLSQCSCIDEVVVVAQHAQHYPSCRARIIGDLQPDLGPIGGLITALVDLDKHKSDKTWALVTSCDLLNLSSQHVDRLVQAIDSDKGDWSIQDDNSKLDEEGATSGLEAVLFQSVDFQPFPGLFSTSLVSQLQTMLASDEKNCVSMRSLASRLGARLSLAPMICQSTGQQLPRLIQCNTQAELKAYIQPNDTNE